MEIRNLKETEITDILKAFNTSFSDYFVPFKLTEEQLVSKMKADKTDFGLSVGVFENQKLIAFILHGVDTIGNQKVAYNGGTGVIPSKRGAGLTKKMYLHNLTELRKKGVDKIVLEVISQNIQAIKSYEKTGFKTIRELICFKGSFKPTKPNQIVTIGKLEPYDWKKMESFWDITPTWQNSKNVVNSLKMNNDSYGAYLNDLLVGYVIFSPKNNRVQQIAVDKAHRKNGIASRLLTELSKKHGNVFSIINIDKKARNVSGFLGSVGLQNYLEQLEMELILH